MTLPTDSLHLTDTELRLLLEAVTEVQPLDMPRQDLRRRLIRKIAAALAIAERPFKEPA